MEKQNEKLLRRKRATYAELMQNSAIAKVLAWSERMHDAWGGYGH